MQKPTFGERLKREREMRGVSLEEIAAATRIGTRFLIALENEDWERLPGGVFNRGFIRAVARFLGLDEEGLVAEYATATNDRPQAAWTKSDEEPQRRTWLRVAVVAVLVAALVAGGWFAYRRYGTQLLARWKAPRPASSSLTINTESAATSPAVNTSPAAVPATADSSAAGAIEPAMLELKVEAGKTTRISIAADQKNIFDGLLIAGESRQFQAKEQFDVTAQDSSAVLLELNGQTVPPLGPPNQQGRVKLTRQDLKKPQPPP